MNQYFQFTIDETSNKEDNSGHSSQTDQSDFVLDAYSEAVIKAADRINPSVVKIDILSKDERV